MRLLLIFSLATFGFSWSAFAKVSRAAASVDEPEAVNEEKEYPARYRVIFTSPRELVNAIIMPQPPHQILSDDDKDWKGIRSKSRLQRFFNVKNKVVEGQTVTLELEPRLPLIGSVLSDTTTLRLAFKEISRSETKYIYAVNALTKEGAKIFTRMTITPSSFGSLLKLELISESAWSDIFIKMVTTLDLISRTPEEAEAKAKTESI